MTTAERIAVRELVVLADCIRAFEASREYITRSSVNEKQVARRMAPLEASLNARMMALFMLCGVA